MGHVPPQGSQLYVVLLPNSTQEVELLQSINKRLVGWLVHELKVEYVGNVQSQQLKNHT